MVEQRAKRADSRDHTPHAVRRPPPPPVEPVETRPSGFETLAGARSSTTDGKGATTGWSSSERSERTAETTNRTPYDDRNPRRLSLSKPDPVVSRRSLEVTPQPPKGRSLEDRRHQVPGKLQRRLAAAATRWSSSERSERTVETTPRTPYDDRTHRRLSLSKPDPAVSRRPRSSASSTTEGRSLEDHRHQVPTELQRRADSDRNR